MGDAVLVTVGLIEGLPTGARVAVGFVGIEVLGLAVLAKLGAIEGCTLGARDGLAVGASVGSSVGATDGKIGIIDGTTVGKGTSSVGPVVGTAVGAVGCLVDVGERVAANDGLRVVGAAVGLTEGAAVTRVRDVMLVYKIKPPLEVPLMLVNMISLRPSRLTSPTKLGSEPIPEMRKP